MKMSLVVNLLLSSILFAIAAAAPLVLRCHLSGSLKAQLQSLENGRTVDQLSIDHRGKNVIIRVDSETWAKLQSTRGGTDCSVVIQNLEEYLIQHNAKQEVEAEEEDDQAMIQNYFGDYQPYDKIMEFYNGLKNQYEDLVTIDKIGGTHGKSDIYSFEISAADKPAHTVYMQCLVHAREWIAGPTCMYMAKYILEKYKADDADVKTILSKAKVAMIPIVNPDGYKYTWTKPDDPKVRQWRKNRAPTKNDKCPGVDINRNFPFMWNTLLDPDDIKPCEDSYKGSEAGSELETKTVMKYYSGLTSVVAALDMHSFHQSIIRPYAWTRNNPNDKNRLQEVGVEMSALMKAVDNHPYDVGNSQQTIGYTASGSAGDWFYELKDKDMIRAAPYVIELRPTLLEAYNTVKDQRPQNPDDMYMYAFGPPKEQIIKACEETAPAIIYLFKTMLGNPLKFKE